MDVFLHMAIVMVLTAIKTAVKNPTKAAELREYLIEVKDAISALYPDENPLP